MIIGGDQSITIYAYGKINIGLFIKNKRPDAYHEIETLFYPVDLYDEIKIYSRSLESEPILFTKGISIPGKLEQNLCIRSWFILKERFPNKVFPVAIELTKSIPPGSGIGGGSSNAAAVLKSLNLMCNLNLSKEELKSIGKLLGADVPYFIEGRPQYATGIGDILENYPIEIPYKIKVVTNDIFCNTAEAYNNLNLAECSTNVSLKDLLKLPITEWKDQIINDFEKPIFLKHPEIRKSKEKLYQEGAIYASMTGTGSAVYGFFPQKQKD